MTLSEPDRDAAVAAVVASPSPSPDESEIEEDDSGEPGDYQDMDANNDDGSGARAGGGGASAAAGTPKRSAASAKDPNRPRRKKARRACFACQRAHLTCGDERPCHRCIKRGLQDACQDGVRKKAKYLHDAPNEALMPGASGSYTYLNSVRHPQQQSPQNPQYGLSSIGDVYGPRPASFNMSSLSPTGNQLPEQLINNPGYGPQQSPMAGYPTSATQAPSSMQSLVQALETSAPPGAVTSMQDFGGAAGASGIYDTGDLSQYDFDPASFNFGNHYGALEFGMLGHMSSGAAETPPSDAMSHLNPASGGMYTTPGSISSTFSPDGGAGAPQSSYMFAQDVGMGEWRPPTQPQSNVRQGVGNPMPPPYVGEGLIKKENLDGLIVDTAVGSTLGSPSSDGMNYNHGPFDGSDPASSRPDFTPSSTNSSRPGTQERLAAVRSAPGAHGAVKSSRSGGPGAATTAAAAAAAGGPAPSASAFAPAQPRGNPSHIYAAITEPHSYTNGFHRLIAYIKRRFSPAATVRIAAALAAIRPSFISCTKTLGAEDLVFMEKCFQRTLWEYAGYIAACGTPTLVCRRTGEVAAVGREFCHLTGWKRDVLLGRAPNLNVNTGGGAGSGGAGGAGITSSGAATGTTTPRNNSAAAAAAAAATGEGGDRPLHPVFLTELLDDESAIEFYDDFSRLAFGDPRGSKVTTYRLLRYQSAASGSSGESADRPAGSGGDGAAAARRHKARPQDRRETAADELGGPEGKIECVCSWTVKRDLFDLPMMIVMNTGRYFPLGAQQPKHTQRRR